MSSDDWKAVSFGLGSVIAILVVLVIIRGTAECGIEGYYIPDPVNRNIAHWYPKGEVKYMGSSYEYKYNGKTYICPAEQVQRVKAK